MHQLIFIPAYNEALRIGDTLARVEAYLARQAYDSQVAVVDDGSTPIEEAEELWPRFDGGADVAVGSRALPESDVVVRQAWYRARPVSVRNVKIKPLSEGR